jgi:hypothetical protein
VSKMMKDIPSYCEKDRDNDIVKNIQVYIRVRVRVIGSGLLGLGFCLVIG